MVKREAGAKKELGNLAFTAYTTHDKVYFKLLDIINNDLIYFELKITGLGFFSITFKKDIFIDKLIT